MSAGRDVAGKLCDAVRAAREAGTKLRITGSGSKTFLTQGLGDTADARLLSVTDHHGIVDYRPEEPNASQHLRQLREAGLVTAQRDGKFVRYGLADDSVLDLIASVHGVAARRRAEVSRIETGYFDARDAMEPISRAELVKRARDGTVTVIDVRSEDEFALGHVPDALCVPLGDLESRLAELDPAQQIVAYCRGPWCVLSFEAVARLRALGYDARRLEDGYPEWRAAGMAVAEA